MGSAVLTACLFALSAIFGGRSARIFGSFKANLGRMIVALTLLGVWAFTYGKNFSGVGVYWFVLSGCVGFGLGDMALFGALPRIGPRLALLLTQCLAGPVAGLAEWAWLGQRIQLSEALAGLVILIGVAVALLPDRKIPAPRFFWAGVGFGILSALGQGLGAVISRKATAVNLLANTPIDGGTAAFQRMLGGFAVISLFMLPIFWRRKNPRRETPTGKLPFGWHYILLNGLVGPSLGVGFYQYALSTTPSAIVLAIVATSPVIVMLLQFAIKEEKPTLVPVLGACMAVGGAVALATMKG